MDIPFGMKGTTFNSLQLFKAINPREKAEATRFYETRTDLRSPLSTVQLISDHMSSPDSVSKRMPQKHQAQEVWLIGTLAGYELSYFQT
jgi:hypothetical protein